MLSFEKVPYQIENETIYILEYVKKVQKQENQPNWLLGFQAGLEASSSSTPKGAVTWPAAQLLGLFIVQNSNWFENKKVGV